MLHWEHCTSGVVPPGGVVGRPQRCAGPFPSLAQQNDELLKLVNEAYAVLSEASKRREYDLSNGHAGVRHSGFRRRVDDVTHGRRAAEAAAATGWNSNSRWDAAASDASSSSDARFDWAEWNRMHFGPTDEERARFYDQVRMGGYSGPWEDPSLSDRTNYYARRKAQEWVASKGLSETQHYREYAKRCVGLGVVDGG